MKVRGSLLLAVVQCAFLLTGWAQGKATVRLLLDSTEVPAGSTVQAAIELTPPKGWHTYWRNPGDSGQRTKVQWTLPDGVTASELSWPPPQIHQEAGMTTYVYEGRVLLPVRLMVGAGVGPGPLALSARVTWLECDKECVPGKATATGTLSVAAARVASPEVRAIESAVASLPRPDPTIVLRATWAGPAEGDERFLNLSIPTTAATGFQTFLPYEQSGFELATETGSNASRPGMAAVRIKVTKMGEEWPVGISGLLAYAGGRSVDVAVPIASGDPGDPALASADGDPVSEASGGRPLAWMLGLAFLGGLILNIMPCVLPVIALKILGFVKQSREAPGRVRILGLVYTAGVLSSFLVLAIVVIGLQGAGRSASWGMQFQNPVFVVVITTLVTLVALNLFGVFEVTLGAGAQGTAAGLASRGGTAGAFFNGVFTTVLATPCTAPFLGVALGFAFSQPPLVLLLMFLTAGLGLAAPYLLLSIEPSWLRFLPKPGNWMITFKMLMGFPMLATALWLLTLAPDHFGPEGVFWMGMFLLLVAFAAWLYGRSIQLGQGRRGPAWAGIIAALAVGVGVILEGELHWRSPDVDVTSAPSPATRRGGIAWMPWSPAAVEEARRAGHPVLVDFTAKYCFTCIVNEKVAIEIPEVREQLRAINAVTLRGDYTLDDPAITAELKRFKRVGVPLVLVYPADLALPPRALPGVLTPSIVQEALTWAANPAGKPVAAN
ncbi:MAG: thioredoxin family protein [Verrucomicrobia bacterium]|nr:thioredoxin family protein [Verrucomicrobiota bacterium]